MANQQLLDYVRQQLQQGANKEQIKNALLSSGWPIADIDEALNYSVSPTKPDDLSKFTFGNQSIILKTPKKLLLVVAVLIGAILILSGGAYFVLQKFLTSSSGTKLGDELILRLQKEAIVSTSTDVSVSANNKVVKTADSIPQKIDCGTTTNYQLINCFIDAAKNCSPAKIIISGNYGLSDAFLEMAGFLPEITRLHEIQGRQADDKCMFYTKLLDGKATISPEGYKEALSQGATEAQIKQAEKEASASMQASIGQEGICKFADTNSIVSLFQKWQKGSFSINDFKNFDCIGNYFNIGDQAANTSKTITNEGCVQQRGEARAITKSGTACFKDQIDLGTIVGALKIDDKYPQCCVYK